MSKEIASGAKQKRAERKMVLALAQARKVILVTEHRTDPPGPLGQVRRTVLNVLKIPFRVFSSFRPQSVRTRSGARRLVGWRAQ